MFPLLCTKEISPHSQSQFIIKCIRRSYAKLHTQLLSWFSIGLISIDIYLLSLKIMVKKQFLHWRAPTPTGSWHTPVCDSRSTESWAGTRASRGCPATRREKCFHHSPVLLPAVKQETCMNPLRAISNISFLSLSRLIDQNWCQSIWTALWWWASVYVNIFCPVNFFFFFFLDQQSVYCVLSVMCSWH